MKYERTKKKFGSVVQQFKEGPQGRYQGEQSGIKGNVIKSTKH